MPSKPTRPRTAEDAFTSLRSGPLNPNGIARPVLLWLLTLLLWLPGLGNLPLRDWDEGRVATVARSTVARSTMARVQLDSAALNGTALDASLFDGLLAFKWDEAYLNKPPGLHWLIGGAIHLGGEQEWVVRLVPCLIASLAVPLILLLRRQLGGADADTKAVLAALILATLLPMARHGRLAMLDGSLVTSVLLLWTGWLSSRRQPWLALVAGLGGSGILLLKPPALLGFALITAVISLWDRHSSRWHRSCLLWLGLGLSPGLAWHFWHWHQRGSAAWLMWGGQGLGRITEVVGDSSGAWVMPITEVLEGGWPWLLLLPVGLQQVFRQRHQSASRWQLGLLLGSAALVLPLRTQLPWYSHLLWPAIALICADGLSQVLNSGRPYWVSRIWSLMGAALLLIAAWLLLVGTPQALPWDSLLWAGAGLLAGGLQLLQPQRQLRRRGLITLLLGWSVALLALWHSQLWLWELNESWDPRPVASAIRQLPPDATVMLKGPTRPSLGWYAGRELLPNNARPDGEHWQVSRKPPNHCAPVPGSASGTSSWQLWHCKAPGTTVPSPAAIAPPEQP